MAVENRPVIRTQMSPKELERRWKAVRQAMQEANLDFLIMQKDVSFRVSTSSFVGSL